MNFPRLADKKVSKSHPILSLVIIFTGAFLDQGTKNLMRSLLATQPFYAITSWWTWVYAWNPGVSFGLLASAHNYQRWALAIAILIITGGMIVGSIRAERAWQRWGFALVAAGALGNLWDRVWHGAVFDFILVHWGVWAFPAFNVADMLVSMGFLALVCDSFQCKAWSIAKKTPLPAGK